MRVSAHRSCRCRKSWRHPGGPERGRAGEVSAEKWCGDSRSPQCSKSWWARRRGSAREPEAMKTITRRLGRLEESYGLRPETEFDRRLRTRIEAAQRRLAEARERGEVGPPETGPHFEARRRRFVAAVGFFPAVD